MPSAIAIDGGRDVTGNVRVSGSKNAGLPLMAATLLAPGPSTLHGLPPVSDIKNMGSILQYLGGDVSQVSDNFTIDTTDVTSRFVPAQLTDSLRASILFLGPLLARFGHACLSFPGGCSIGNRPVEEHINGLRKLGACITVTDTYIEAHAPQLQGATIDMQTPSVTGTMNLIMAACLARGVTHIHNAAREPEVGDLINFLVLMGVDIHGAGTDQLVIHGRHSTPLSPCQYGVMEDRIEVGTFLILGAICGNPLTVYPCHPEQHVMLIKNLKAVGARVDISDDSVTVWKAKQPLAFMVLLCLAQGTSHVTESVFERRFGQCFGLRAMGAGIRVCERTAVISGVEKLSGALVSGSDLRATASLILAAVVGRGRSVVGGIKYLDRGYYHLERKLAKIGVAVERCPGLYPETLNQLAFLFRGDSVVESIGLIIKTKKESEPGPRRLFYTYNAIVAQCPPVPGLRPHDMHSISNDRFSFLLLCQPTFISYIAYCKLPKDKQCVWPNRVRFTDDDMEALARKLADYPICESVVFGELWRTRTKAQLISLEEGALDHWFFGRTVMAGDAIHKGTTKSALGGCTAMEDGVAITNQLHQLLNRHRNKKPSTVEISAAMQEYQDSRLDRAFDGWYFYIMQRWLTPWIGLDTLAINIAKLAGAGTKLSFVDFPEQKGLLGWQDTIAWYWTGDLQQIWPLLVGFFLCFSSTLLWFLPRDPHHVWSGIEAAH
ncbi:RNA 3'-terminal phosphate cyclase/enolpyruvate transferase [Aspergillus flavus]|uniref:UDP-N-acetylglucosamine 1-carboxyvinyltransferase n=1 Tax=Aspergillus flavus TaxID=5059 RepID=A0A5N6HCB4_ASPFL|nr:RNA 3'-terminal phosphate cyclase/enolpyruvate transferase [Aspergillus flavus]